jgi:hypothetical protein
MTFYSVALFLHIAGALGLFAAVGLEWTSLLHLRRAATAEQAREWLSVVAGLRRVYPAAFVIILLSGFYMTATAWGGTGWIGVALGTLLLLAAVGATLTGLRMPAIGRAVALETGPLSPALRHRLRDPLLWTSVQTRAALVLGIVFLMSVKPDLGGGLLTTGVAAVLGLASALPAWERTRVEIPAA